MLSATLACVLLASCTLWTVLGLRAVVRSTARRVRHGARASSPPITVLKPLCGAEVGLESCLESFFEQDYACFELVFGVENPSDPALAVVARLQARHPHVSARVIIHAGNFGINPKVSNLRGMLPAARHDLLLVSDSNVRAPIHMLLEAVESFQSEPNVGLVTNLFAGIGERQIGSALQNVQLNGFCAAGVALPTRAGDAAVIGKSMLFSRATFESLGGFERVAAVLAEDWVIGKMFQHAGLRVCVARTVLEHVTSGMNLADFLRRQLRWSMLRSRLRPLAYVFEPVASPVAMLPFAWWCLGPVLAVLWMLAMLWLRDVGGWYRLRGRRRAWVAMGLAPLRDVAMLAVWACAPFCRHITWRGHRVRVSTGTLVFVAASPAPQVP